MGNAGGMSLFICLIQTCLSQPLDVRTMIGQGEGKEIREEQIGDSHHKRQSLPVPPGELQSMFLREGPQSEGSGDMSALHCSPQSDTGGETQCGTCWETQLLNLCVLSGCKRKVSNQVI